MTQKPLYRYYDAEGHVIVSTAEPDGAYTPMTRLIADKGMVLRNGDDIAPCVDVSLDDVVKWQEEIEVGIDNNAKKAKAYDILMGVTE